jgi:hypothetical protein
MLKQSKPKYTRCEEVLQTEQPCQLICLKWCPLFN